VLFFLQNMMRKIFRREGQMGKKIKFENKSKQALYIEFGNQNNFIEGMPECFNNAFDGYANLSVIDAYGMFFPNGDTTKKPFIYFRHTDVIKNKHRFAGLLDLGDDYLSPQKGVHHFDEVAGSETPVTPYGKVSENPLIFGFKSEGKFVDYQFHKDFFKIKEGDFFNVKAEPWNFTIYDHQSIIRNVSLIFQPSTFLGSFDDNPVIGLGSYDRFCMKQNIKSFEEIKMEYMSFSGMGIRDDGRKELALVSVSINDSGKIVAYYYLEGEQPIITDHVIVEADWTRLPYVDDGTCTFKNATFSFCGKEIHFEGKWGSKGFTQKPRLEKHGQSQVFGTWYEGNTEYKHRIFYTFVENMGAFDYKLKELGFNVIG